MNAADFLPTRISITTLRRAADSRGSPESKPVDASLSQTGSE
jgi:hypothetical protein